MKLFIEVFFVKINLDKVIYHKHQFDITDVNSNPDDLVFNLLNDESNGIPKIANDSFVIHSTSWRYETDKIILTYIVYSDEIDFSKHQSKEFLASDFVIAKGEDSKRPRPKEINELNVLSHAIRHLGFLIRTGEREKYAKAISKENVEFLEKSYTALAGEI